MQEAQTPKCVLHPAELVAQTCTRCGNFMCRFCVEGDAGYCPSCRKLIAPSAFPFHRTDHDFSRLWDFALATFKREWVNLCLAVGVLLIISILNSLLSNVFNRVALLIAKSAPSLKGGLIVVAFVFSTSLGSVLGGILRMGLLRVTIDALQGAKVEVAGVFSQAGRVGHYIVVWLAELLCVSIPLMVMLIPMVSVMISRDLDLTSQMSWVAVLSSPAAAMAIFAGGLLFMVALFLGGPIFYLAVPELV